MENASKALIIAGAILLAILIIGLGVFIYNQASNTVSDTGMDQVAIRQFNGQFEPYINKTIDSTAAKALIDTVKQSSDKVHLMGATNKNDIKIGHKYTTDVRYSNGVISEITLSDINESALINDGETGTYEDLATISAADFNAAFEKFLGNDKTIEEKEDLDILINKINDRYGPGTVSYYPKKWGCGVGEILTQEGYNISVKERYDDDKIRVIYARLIYTCESGASEAK